MIRDIVLVEYLAMFLVWLTVVIVYWATTRGRWARSPEGRMLMADAALYVWITSIILGQIFFRDWPGRIWISVFSLGLFTLTGLWRLRLTLRAWQARKAARRASAPESGPWPPAQAARSMTPPGPDPRSD
jgi:hypothetical protein